MEILQSCFVAEEDLLDFTLDGAGGDEEAVGPTFSKAGASASYSSGESAASFGRGTQARLFPEFVEEELEWLSNKDAFPAVETCFGILSDNPQLVSNNNNSPVSVLDNSSGASSNNTSGTLVASCCTSLKVPANYPVRARTKRSRRKRRAGFADIFCPWMMPRVGNSKKRDFSTMSKPAPVATNNGGAVSGGIGRRCLHCQTDKTPQWRAGPNGPKTLCNACGVRYKSGRLLPEYRPANSPTFSSRLHSNSHRKVVEMRRQKEARPGEGVTEVNVACGYSVG